MSRQRQTVDRISGPTHRRRWLIIALVGLLALLQYRLWLGRGGLADLHHARTVLAQITASNDSVKKSNAALQADVVDLSKGGAAIEAQARTQLGMIHKGETFYLVVHPSR